MDERVALVENFLECRLSGRVDEASAYLADEVVYERGKKGCLVGTSPRPRVPSRDRTRASAPRVARQPLAVLTFSHRLATTT